MIERSIIKKIVKALKHFPAVAILGARQTGKTTLSKMIEPHIDKECLYIDLENPRDTAMLANPLSFFAANPDKCIIIDEVQRMPELFPLLRSVIDLHRVPARFILLGSASTDLLFMSGETLTGRIAYFELNTFVYPEIKHLKTVQEHWFGGGFPQIVLIDDQEFRENWYRSFLTTYIERDFRLLGLDATPGNLSRFFTMLAHLTGNLLNKSSLAKSMGLYYKLIDNYLDYFEKAFLINQLSAWSSNLKKRLVKSPKIYIRDTGLLHYLHRIKDFNGLLANPILGNSWESYIIEQIINILGKDFSFYYYRTQDGTECDLVITDAQKILAAVEIKFSDAPRNTKSFTIAIDDLQSQNNYLIVPENKIIYHLNEKVKVCNLEQFLDDFQKMNG